MCGYVVCVCIVGPSTWLLSVLCCMYMFALQYKYVAYVHKKYVRVKCDQVQTRVLITGQPTTLLSRCARPTPQTLHCSL